MFSFLTFMSTTSRTLPLRCRYATLRCRYAAATLCLLLFTLHHVFGIEIHMVLPRMAGYCAPINPAGKSVEVRSSSGVASPGSPAGTRRSREHWNASLRTTGKRVRVSDPDPRDLQRDSDDDDGSTVDDESESSRTDR